MPENSYRFHTLDVFTDRLFGGNPLAVFPDAQGLEDATMQRVAREMSLSETVFVFPPRDSRSLCRLRIFTPSIELPFAGHPTVGTGFLLALLGRIALRGPATHVVFEEEVGLVPVTVFGKDGQPDFVQLSAAALPVVGPPPPSRDVLAAMLGIAADEILHHADSVEAVSCGVPFLFIPVRDRGVLARVRVDVEHWRRSVSHFWAHHVFVFCRDPEMPGSSIRARMFAPEMGIVEDPATGAAATALGGHLGMREATRTGTLRWRVEQGFEMGRPSLLDVEADKKDGAITAVRVGGRAVMVTEGVFRLA